MRLLYLTDQIYMHVGRERVLAEKANYFSDKFAHEIFILTTEQKGHPPLYPISKKVKIIDLEVNYRRDKSYFSLVNLVKIIEHYLRLKLKIKEINPDIIIILSSRPDSFFLNFISGSIPRIKEFHSSFFAEDESGKGTHSSRKILKKLERYLDSKYDLLVVLNDRESRNFSSPNVAVIPNAVTYWPSEIAKLENKTVIAAGRIAPVKGFDIMLKIWSEVIKSHPEWKLEIYGQGERHYEDYLIRMVDELGLKESAFFCGSTRYLEEKMLDSSVYVLSSYSECFPTVLLEAFACGLPAVSFDCPTGPGYIITNNKDGFLVRPGDVSEFAKKLSTLMDNVEMRKEFGLSARSSVRKFAKESVMQTWNEIFENLKNKSS